MKRAFVVFSVFLIAVLPVRGETTMAEVRRLKVAVALLDYPVEQNKVRDALGIPAEVTHSFGSEDWKRGTYWIWPLYRLGDGSSYYALKVFYSSNTKETTGRTPLITAIEVIFFSIDGGHFVADINSSPLPDVPRLKAMMKKSGQTPKEFTVNGALEEHLREAELEARRERIASKSKNEANPSSEPKH